MKRRHFLRNGLWLTGAALGFPAIVRAQVMPSARRSSSRRAAGINEVSFDAGSGVCAAVAAANISINHTVGDGSNRAIVAFVFCHNGETPTTVTGVTYAGSDLSYLGSSRVAYGQTAEVWYIVNPDTGSNSLIATFSATPSYRGLLVASFGKVNASTPVSGLQSFQHGSASSHAFDVVSQQGGLVIQGLYIYGSDPTYSDGDGQTMVASYESATEVNVYASRKTGETSTNITFSLNPAAKIAHQACSVNPA